MASSRRNGMLCLAFGVLVFFIGIILMWYYGLDKIAEAKELTQELCFIKSTNQKMCTYSCGKKSCYGKNFEYTGSGTKCPNQILESIDSFCPNFSPKASPNTTANCEIPLCSRNKFYLSSSSLKVDGPVLVSFAALLTVVLTGLTGWHCKTFYCKKKHDVK